MKLAWWYGYWRQTFKWWLRGLKYRSVGKNEVKK